MTVDLVTQIMADAMYTILITALPPLLISMVVGLIISIFQTVTSIQEQTLTFVPKVIGVFVMIMLMGNWMLTELSGYITNLWSDFSKYVR